MTYAPNDLEPCPSQTARRRHIALAEWCLRCGTDGRRTPMPTLAEVLDKRRQDWKRGVL